MVWNVNDWSTQEDDCWKVLEEDSDDEFDDLKLSRLGIDIKGIKTSFDDDDSYYDDDDDEDEDIPF